MSHAHKHEGRKRSGDRFDRCRPEKIGRQLRKTSKSPYFEEDYPKIGSEFAKHGTVIHSADEYVRLGGFYHSNTAENFFSILKRGVVGVYHRVSEDHLGRYLDEFDLRSNARKENDTVRTEMVLRNIEGKRQTYRRIGEAVHA